MKPEVVALGQTATRNFALHKCEPHPGSAVLRAAGFSTEGDFGVAGRGDAEQQRAADPPIPAPSGMKVKNTSIPL